MAENRGNLTSYRPDIKVMDCTLRDGGLVNNFEFTDEFVKDWGHSDAIRRFAAIFGNFCPIPTSVRIFR